MTSATADMIQTPPARPEPAAARKPVINDKPATTNKFEAPADQKSFAEHLDEQKQAQPQAGEAADASAKSAKPAMFKKAAANSAPSTEETAAQPKTAKAPKVETPDTVVVVPGVAQALQQTNKPKVELLVAGAEQAAANATAVVPTDAAAAVAKAAQPKAAAKPAKAGAEKPEAKIDTAAAEPAAQPAVAPSASAAQAAPIVQAPQTTTSNTPAKPAAKPAAEAVGDAVAAPRAADTAEASLTPSNADTQEANAAKQQVHPAAQNAQANPNQANTTHAQANAQAAADAVKPDVKVAAAINAADAANTLASSSTTKDAGQASPAQAALQSAPPATIQVATRFIERFEGRAQRFEVRLDPAELGRVDVRIEVGADKKVHAVLAAHDSAALTDLMRGQRSLEQALRDSGIDVADGGIKFELSQDNGRNFSSNQSQSDARGQSELANAWRGFSTVDVAVDQPVEAVRSYSPRSSRLDLVA